MTRGHARAGRDDLAAARGVVLGLEIAALFWFCAALAAAVWWCRHGGPG